MNLKDIQVIVRIRQQDFAIPAEHVKEMVSMPECTHLPQLPDYARGVINLRGRVLPVVDMRRMMGLPTAQSEAESMVEMLQQREADHHRWINELEGSIRERREFKLTTDPTRCAFGKWYYSFQAEEPSLRFLLKQFDEPHRMIHELGVAARKLYDEGRIEEATNLIELSRTSTLSLLVNLFQETYQMVRKNVREIGVILFSGEHAAVFAVDSVLAVETLGESSSEALEGFTPGAVSNRYFNGIGKRRGDQSLVLLADPDRLLGCVQMT